MKRSLILFLLALLTNSAWALNTITPPAPPASKSSDSMTDEKPSQEEVEKAPATNRPTAVPKFSLPDVVITGENELTISAKRLTQKESDVTLGAQNLSNLDRSSDDLPGLDKTITALSTQESGSAEKMALILHGGGGFPGTYGGWGLFAHDLTGVLYSLSGYYSTWAGQATATGFDGDRRFRLGGDMIYKPDSKFDIGLAAYYNQVDAELPYESSLRELHQGSDIKTHANWNISEKWTAQALVGYRTTVLTNYWGTVEFDGSVKVKAYGIDPILDLVIFEVGGRITTSSYTVPSSIYNWGWVSLGTEFDIMENLTLGGAVEGQAGNISNLSSNLFPSANLTWRPLTNTQVMAAWRTARKMTAFNDVYLDTEHVILLSVNPIVTETTSEFEGKITQRVTETLVLTGFASTAQLVNYHQWTDINPLTPAFIYKYSSIPLAQMTHLGAGAQWNFMRDWKLSGDYLWTQATNNSGLNFTQLPINQGTVSLNYNNDELEAKLGVLIADSRQGSDTTVVTLPAYATLNLGAAYHFTKTFSLWLTGDNLLGQSFQIQPGYLEPQYHVRGGVEIIF